MWKSVGAEQAGTGVLVWKGPLASAGIFGSLLLLHQPVLSQH